MPNLQGYGRKTICEIAVELGKDTNEIIELLAKNNIKAKPTDNLKTVAEEAGKTPMDILAIIR